MTTQTQSPRPVPPASGAPSSTKPAPSTDLPALPRARRTASIGRVVAASLSGGLVAALLLVLLPLTPVEESAVTGAVLAGFAVGWALLAFLSTRFTDQPQRWAAAPAALMGIGGLLLLAFGAPAREVLAWVWPPAVLGMAIWMGVHVRRHLGSRGGRSARAMLYPVIAVLALGAVGGAYQTLGERADAATHPMPGQLVDVGGRSLHLSCTGSGSPTVVLQAGGGEMSSNLGWIAPAIAHDTQVCVYDRAGHGWSELADTPQDAMLIAADLHTMLQRAGVPGPYVLAGHSFGGLYALTFAARYPDDVAGMVLVDSTAPAAAPQTDAPPAEAGSYDVMARVSTLLSTSARLGLSRLAAQSSFDSLPSPSREDVRARLATADNLRTTIDEYVQASASMQEAAALTDLGHKPLVVLTAGSESAPTWATSQHHLATLSTNSVHRVIESATHQTLIADERDAARTSEAVLDVVSSVRSAQPLLP